jgi:hypothetical protein
MSTVRKELLGHFEAASNLPSSSAAPVEEAAPAGRWGAGAWKGRNGAWAPKVEPIPSPSEKAKELSDTKVAPSPLAPQALPVVSAPPQPSQPEVVSEEAMPKTTSILSPTKDVDLSLDAPKEPQESLTGSTELVPAKVLSSASRRPSGGAIAGLQALASAVTSPPTSLGGGVLLIHVQDELKSTAYDFEFDREVLLNATR